jgi:hypothetical protein
MFRHGEALHLALPAVIVTTIKGGERPHPLSEAYRKDP